MRRLSLVWLFAAGVLLCAGVSLAATAYDLGREFAAAEAWRDLTWDMFGARHPGVRYSVTDGRTRMLLPEDFTFFGYPLCEAEVAFGGDGRLDRLSVSLFNKGDAGSLATDEEAFAAVGSLPFFSGAKPAAVVGDGRGKTIACYDWADENLSAEARIGLSSPTGLSRRVEYVTVELARNRPRETTQASPVPAENLRREGSTLFIDGIPMVQQGQKGYCAPATLARVLRYYGIETDMHELALLLETDAGGGTRVNAAFPSLTRVAREAGLVRTDYWRIGAEKPAPEAFARAIRDCIDRGYPLVWAVSRTFPWDGSGEQGGHMRLVVGYDAAQDTLVYSDSWGAKSLRKRAPLEAAYGVTEFLTCLHPAEP